jgi:hypothetical protein
VISQKMLAIIDIRAELEFAAAGVAGIHDPR